MGEIKSRRATAGDAVTIPRKTYEAMLAEIEDLQDALALKTAQSNPPESYLPFEKAERILEGECPVRVWREHRGLSAAELAEAAGLSRSYLSEIESGRKTGSAKTLAAIAKVLGLTVDDLI